jgi:hypothetical protein
MHFFPFLKVEKVKDKVVQLGQRGQKSMSDEVVNMILGIITVIAVLIAVFLAALIDEALNTRTKFINLMSAMQEDYGEITLNYYIGIYTHGGKGVNPNDMVRILSNKRMHEIQPPSRTHPDYDNKIREYHAQKINYDNNTKIEAVKVYAEQVYNKRMKERNTLTLDQILE